MGYKKNRSLVLLILTCVYFTVNSQDIHFSQFFNASSTINPSLTGFTNSRIRAFVNHRNQWASVTLPFQTYAATIDAQVLKRKQKGDMFGVGLSAYSDKAGDSQFGTQSASFSLNYVRALGSYTARNLIGFGVTASIVQRSLDYQKLIFDNQYNGTIFDPSLNHGELFAVDNYQYIDVAVGMNWFTNINYDINLQMGLSAWHLTMPMQSLLNDQEVRLPIKLIFHAESEISFDKPYRLLPALFVQHQGTQSEIVFGSRFKYSLNLKADQYKAFLTGIFYRNNDAMIVYTGYQYHNMVFGLSYDFNISSLRKASHYLGGIELTLNWQLEANRHPKPKDLPCPIF